MEIYILRHGIAEAGGPGKPDAQRELTKEGREKLADVLKRAGEAGVKPSLILSSPLIRAVQTAEAAAKALGYTDAIVQTASLAPESEPAAAWDEIRSHREQGAILLAGHHPLLGDLTGYLLRSPSLQIDMKKAALIRIDVESLRGEPRGLLKWMLTPRVS